MAEHIYRLTGKIQHYAWGGQQFIHDFLNLGEQTGKPLAEYWMGAHPSASSTIHYKNSEQTLDRLIQEDPTNFLGEKVKNKFGELPYLFKVLDVHEMLSIQVHPSKSEAIKGFDAEEAAGIPLNAPHRNYKDKNHKPEVMVALSVFWLLHGFKEEDALLHTLKNVPEFNALLPLFEQGGYEALYKNVMELSQNEVDEMLTPLVKRELAQIPDKNEPGYWVKQLFKDGQPLQNMDRGIFSIYFFNIVQVQPGQAVFQGAGIPHAYLEGQNVELMANSDNVLRGGLTPKHIDVIELMKHTTFEGVKPNVMQGEWIDAVERNYPCPVDDFGISAIQLDKHKTYIRTSKSPEIYLVTSGSVQVGNSDVYKKGASFYVAPDTEVSLSTDTKAIIYKAFVPL